MLFLVQFQLSSIFLTKKMSTFEEVPQFEIIEALGRTLKGISSIALTYDVIVNQCEM